MAEGGGKMTWPLTATADELIAYVESASPIQRTCTGCGKQFVRITSPYVSNGWWPKSRQPELEVWQKRKPAATSAEQWFGYQWLISSLPGYHLHCVAVRYREEDGSPQYSAYLRFSSVSEGQKPSACRFQIWDIWQYSYLNRMSHPLDIYRLEWMAMDWRPHESFWNGLRLTYTMTRGPREATGEATE